MRRRWGWSLLGVAVAVLVVAGVVFVRDANAVAGHLADAHQSLVRARTAVSDGDVDLAREATGTAAEDIEAAESRLDGPLWAVAEAIPQYGASAEAARGAVDLARAATTLARTVSEQAGDLIDAGAAAFIGDDGRIRTDQLRQLSSRLQDLPVGPVEEARDRLAELPEGGLVGAAERGRDDALAAADETLGTVTRAQQGMRALSGFLGADGPRTYLLAVQNPGELRGTGGLISYLAELRVEDGQISVRAAGVDVVDDLDPLSRPGQTGNTVSNLDAVPRPTEFADRYDHNAGGAILQSVNLDPDLPTVGPVLLDLYDARGGQPVDGAILVDPLALAGTVAATGGPLEVPAGLREGVEGIPSRLTPGNLAETLLVTAYDVFGGRNPQRRAFDEAITLAILDRLTGGGWDPVELARALGTATAERHLQLYSTDEDEQAAFQALGIAGQMASPSGERDVLGITAVNAGPDKSDVHVGHRFSGTVDLAAQGTPGDAMRRARLDVAVENPLAPGEHDTYITGSHEPVEVGSGQPPRQEDALNRTWFSVWMPPLTQLNQLRDPVNDQSFRYSNIHGHRAFDYFLETSSESTNSFALDVQGEVPLRRDDDEWVYELTLWRQAKAIPDHWDLTITAPSGWDVTSASVAGGGAPTGMGVGGDDGQRIAATVAGDSVRVAGAVTRDATITVRMSRP